MKAVRARAPRHIEDNEQGYLFDWVATQLNRRPELKLLHAVPNGGRRDVREAARMKRQGVKAGVPDLDLPFPAPGFVGLRIELKRPIVKGEDRPRVSEDQACWLTSLQHYGHCCCVCYGWAQAQESIEAYLTGKPVPHQWERKAE